MNDQQPNLDPYERAIYGAISGDTASVLPVCTSWEDHVWTHVNALFEANVEAGLWASAEGRYWSRGAIKSVELGTARLDVEDPLLGSAGRGVSVRTELEDVFDRMLKRGAGDLEDSANDPYHVAQTHLIVGQVDSMLRTFVDRLEQAALETSQEYVSPFPSPCFIPRQVLTFFSQNPRAPPPVLRPSGPRSPPPQTTPAGRGREPDPRSLRQRPRSEQREREPHRVLRVQPRVGQRDRVVCEVPPQCVPSRVSFARLVGTYGGTDLTWASYQLLEPRRTSRVGELPCCKLTSTASTSRKSLAGPSSLSSPTSAKFVPLHSHLSSCGHRLKRNLTVQDLPSMSADSEFDAYARLDPRQLELIRSLEWLTFDHSTYPDALSQANALTRYFLCPSSPCLPHSLPSPAPLTPAPSLPASDKPHAARELLFHLPDDLLRVVAAAAAPEAGGGEEAASQVREYVDYASLFGCLEKHAKWSGVWAMKPRPGLVLFFFHDWVGGGRLTFPRNRAPKLDVAQFKDGVIVRVFPLPCRMWRDADGCFDSVETRRRLLLCGDRDLRVRMAQA